jgi:hypothetical protein
MLRTLAWLSFGCVALATPALHAEPPYSDLAGREPAVRDLSPSPLAPTESPSGTELSLSMTWVERPKGRDYAAGVVFTIPTERFARPRKAKESIVEEETAAPAEESKPVAKLPPEGPLWPRLRPRDVRAAIAASIGSRDVRRATAHLDDLATRARWSALLPELRLRATRLMDESSSLSPTSYDAERTTSSGGASLWLEARTTWRLDRLAFAEEEVRLVRHRDQLRAERERAIRRVLGLLFAWQRAAFRTRDPSATPEQCFEAWLSEQQLELELDVVTDGWFARWRAKQRLATPSCESDIGAGG